MSRPYCYALSALLLALAAPVTAQEMAPPAIPSDAQVLTCWFIQNPEPLTTDTSINCRQHGRFSLNQLYSSGWRVAHYSVTDRTGAMHHHFIFERR